MRKSNRLFIALSLLTVQFTAIAETSTTMHESTFQKGLTVATLEQQCQSDLSSVKASFQALEKLVPPYTVETILKPVDQLYIDGENATGMTYLLGSVHPEASLREAADKCIQDFSKLTTDINLSKPLFERIQAVDTSKQTTAVQRYHRNLLREFIRSGVDKDNKQREQIRNINESIISLGQTFSKNIREDVREIELGSLAQLTGLPEDYIEAHKPTKENKDKIIITTEYPDLFPFMRYAEDDAARFELYKKYLNRGYPDNDKVLKEIIEQRDLLAKALGYENFATYATEDMMVKNPKVVSDFIKRISLMAEKRADQDYQELLIALQKNDKKAISVGSWQKSYLQEKVRRDKYQVDTKEIREYFQYDNVKQGVFTLVGDLFGVQIKPWQTATWDASVEAYEVWENGEAIGRFYLDMHPRDGKYKHAAQFTVQLGIKNTQLPMATLVCNFPGGDKGPGLMEHGQVETFLHEFGHLIHTIFSGKQQWGRYSGISMEHDFAEAPSQMLEEWVWDYDTLKTFAINQQGEVIPESLLEKMSKARDFARGMNIRNQMFYAALSLNYYQMQPKKLDLTETMIKLQGQYSPFDYIEGTHFYTGFGHLYGYSAAYYTYMWSEVIAADILKQFKLKGMRNTDVAKRYRETILSAGGSKDAAEQVEDFLGRPFNFDAFIERLNQVDTTAK